MKLLVIVGPTASGKTRLGVEVASRLCSEIISADSRQVYRGLDIGTGKDLGEYSAVEPPVPHHLIDIVDPGEVYTLFRYQQDCHQVLRGLSRRPPFNDGTTPALMVGGSGLYIESILRDFRLADVDEDSQLRYDLRNLDRKALEERLLEASPEIHARSDCSSRRRLIRGLEIAAAENKGPVRYTDSLNLELDVRILSITIDRQQMREDIAKRLNRRLQDGMVGEVRDLLDQGVTRERLKSLGLEYREIGAYLAGRKTYRAMVSDLETAIRQFAKRQDTWFRGMPRRGLPVETIESGNVEAALQAVEEWCPPIG
ncbi:MAG: tRNA (adenosine(37)-N6)-dimethylallyltransferase MiaA [Acidobacteria bacterium]|nr:tRNA (adenosine(37)-N6)-dimethylallyltransferase MiaA [Acidobacteriota bacterium]